MVLLTILQIFLISDLIKMIWNLILFILPDTQCVFSVEVYEENAA